MTLQEIQRNIERALCAIDASHEGRELIQHVTGYSWAQLLLHRDQVLLDEQRAQLDALVQERIQGKPLAYLLGEWSFFGHDFIVNESVLIPREDTEVLVRTALDQRENKQDILDLCCGSGCIGISLALAHGWQVSLADISNEALEIAHKNAIKNRAEVSFFESDLLQGIDETFDMIVCNPPYIADGEKLQKEVARFEPSLALYGGVDGLNFYRKLVVDARDALNKDGSLLMEVGYDQADCVRELLQDHGWTNIQYVKDMAGIARVVCATIK